MDTAVFLVRRHPNVHLDLSGIPPKKLLEYLPRLEELSAALPLGHRLPEPGRRLHAHERRRLPGAAALGRRPGGGSSGTTPPPCSDKLPEMADGPDPRRRRRHDGPRHRGSLRAVGLRHAGSSTRTPPRSAPSAAAIEAVLGPGDRQGQALDGGRRCRRATACASPSACATPPTSDFAIEAVPEALDLKRMVFSELDDLCPDRTIFASNTSSLLDHAHRPRDRPPGPRHRHPLLQPGRARCRSSRSCAAGTPPRRPRSGALALVRSLGKEAVRVLDSPGFATSRLGVALGLEAMRMVEEGVASAVGHRPGDGARLRPPDGAAEDERPRRPRRAALRSPRRSPRSSRPSASSRPRS